MKKLIIVGAALVAGGNLFGAIRAVTPDMYGGDTNAWQLTRHWQKMSVVTNGGSKVVFIGDSITHGWEGRGKKQWQKYFAGEPYNALNLGYGADRTEHVLWRITEGKELDGYEAKCVLLMIGTNNTGHNTFEKEPPEDTIFGIRRILHVIRAKQPQAKVVLTAILPRGRDFTDELRRRNEIVNKEICKFADGRDIFWCDFNDQLLTPDGVLPLEVMPDRLHPCEYGYEIWAAAVKPYIDYALSDGRLPAPPNRYAPFVCAENFCVDDPVATRPSTQIVGYDSWQLDRMTAKRTQATESNGAFDIVFLGDSITHGWETKGKETFDELCKTYSILNLGNSGDRTENVLWRCENGGLEGYKAKCVMLMIGTNNSWIQHDKPEAIAAGVKRVLGVIEKKQPQAKVLLLPIFPFGDSPTNWKRVLDEKANAMIKAHADGEKVIWVDFGAKFLDEKGDNVKYMPDHCHPNAEGYREIWLPAVLPYFQKICGK